MARDPAILFYTGDFLNGCAGLTLEERGQYITLLCLQHQTGHLSEKTIKLNVGSVSNDVMRKFEIDKDGCFFQKRMDDEIKKRKINAELQRERINKRWNKKEEAVLYHGNTTVIPEENESEVENELLNTKKKYRNIPPQLSEITERIKEREITSFTADAFFAFYESKGWKVGSQTMKNWDAALTTWNNREHDVTAKPTGYAPKVKSYDEMCMLALNNRDIWKQLVAIKKPGMETVWMHRNDVITNNLTQYEVK